MYLGLDLGTSGIRALLIDGDQSVVGAASAPLSVSRPKAGWSEQAPADWLAAVRSAMAVLKRDHPMALSAVAGIGLSGQMHGATLLDRRDEVLRPAILWNDVRSHAEAAMLDADPRFRAVTGNIVFPGFTAPKLVWVRNNEPDISRRIARVLLPKDYLRLWLTGEAVSDMSDASGTSWLDVGARAWSEPLLGACGLDLSMMPRLCEGSDVSGHLRDAVADELGLPAGIPVAGGAGDNAASACGMGTVAAGTAFVSLGTSGVLFAANDRYLPNPESAVHAFCHALPGAWHQMGVILSAADALNWLARTLKTEPENLTQRLGASLQAPGPALFLPYLSGERTPHNDAEIRGAFLGLSHDSGETALTQAVLEGVAYAIRDSLEALRAAGTELARVSAIGGGSRSDYWLSILATVLDLPIDVPKDGEYGAAFGAARLGLIAATGASPASVCTAPPTARTIEPDTTLTGAFDEAYGRYRAAYPAIKGVYQ